VPIHQIELRHLRYVVAVADDLHFAHAANRLHLAAPSLSKQIRQLETLLGYTLFERRTRQVLLTKAGAAFVLEARQALSHVALALKLSAAANGVESATIAVGYSPWIELPWLLDVRDQFNRQSGTTATFRGEYTASQVENILAARLDAGIVILPVQAPGLEVKALRRERLLLALPENHILAKSEAITFRELADEPFISVNASLKPALHEHLLRLGRQSGFAPKVVHEVTSISEALDLVGSNIGTALVTASYAARFRGHGVAFRECTGIELFVEVGFAHRTGQPSSPVEQLFKLLLNGAAKP
jgi:DNA-binding transcriptional LysR family regulator